ncbi:hypothetical protein CANCADRAFT_146491 [Tortispora caseinolytica NRRL Y-17796]|uniref:Urea active transporter n=1 Tax=Tortispora caseinolytica NRRL Y-17796 TaxID=767744 RepID=A0A1E4T9M7_9ASCO|nr:hypothetical protein CANCADRAFT_146491 [Tortispora caseinolytica NRRL Y-17796]
MSDAAPLPQGAGYGVLIGLGLAFAVGMVLTTIILKRYQHEVVTSEEFSTAGHSVKTGLIASAVVSSWTWSATLLQSSTVAYKYGVSGPFWYASGATVQIILFATIAIELKKKAPLAHTFLEVVRARYGAWGHITYMVFGLFTNILVTVMLFTGGSATISDLTGISPVAACYLLPLGVVIYTLFGGIKATFLTDYVHTVALIVILLIFAMTAYVTGSVLGSTSKMYNLLSALSVENPVPGNAHGSYLTMRSQDGAIFFVINIIGNFGTVFLDNGYWNKAIAAQPAAALPGYIAGGLSWFAIPWLCATTMGLACRALENTPGFPTYPNLMTSAQVDAGLVLPNAAVALLGKGGAVAALILVFMAVTSAASSELIAVSTICTYDIYQTYINPRASGKKLIAAAHVAVVVYGVALSSFAVGLYYGGVSMGWLYLFMGVIISSGVFPAVCTLMWKGQNIYAACLSPPMGLACSLTAWLVTTKLKYGELSIESTGSNIPMLAGNITALLAPIVFVPVLTLLFKPDNYDWKSMANIRSADDSGFTDDDGVPVNEDAMYEKAIEGAKQMHKASKIARYVCVTMAICFLVLWPMPMYGTGYVFSEKFFTGWVVVGIIWMFCSAICVGIIPLWEGRHAMAHSLKGIWGDLRGKPIHHTAVISVVSVAAAPSRDNSETNSLKK